MKWTQTSNTEALSIWQSGDWRAAGTGYSYGNGLRRRWELFEQTRAHGLISHGKMSRLSEAKNFAEQTEKLRANPQTEQYVPMSDDAMRQTFAAEGNSDGRTDQD
jgi:hypothetical protein